MPRQESINTLLECADKLETVLAAQPAADDYERLKEWLCVANDLDCLIRHLVITQMPPATDPCKSHEYSVFAETLPICGQAGELLDEFLRVELGPYDQAGNLITSMTPALFVRTQIPLMRVVLIKLIRSIRINPPEWMK